MRLEKRQHLRDLRWLAVHSAAGTAASMHRPLSHPMSTIKEPDWGKATGGGHAEQELYLSERTFGGSSGEAPRLSFLADPQVLLSSARVCSRAPGLTAPVNR